MTEDGWMGGYSVPSQLMKAPKECIGSTRLVWRSCDLSSVRGKVWLRQSQGQTFPWTINCVTFRANLVDLASTTVMQLI